MSKLDKTHIEDLEMTHLAMIYNIPINENMFRIHSHIRNRLIAGKLNPEGIEYYKQKYTKKEALIAIADWKLRKM